MQYKIIHFSQEDTAIPLTERSRTKYKLLSDGTLLWKDGNRKFIEEESGKVWYCFE